MNKYNKSKLGFTLVELLGVVIILGILIAITSPAVEKIIINSKENAYNAQIADIEKATNDYLLLHPSDIQEQGITIYLENLKKEGLIDRKLKNPKTNKLFSNLTSIKITLKDGIYNFEIIDSDILSNDINELSPMISVAGSVVDYIEVDKSATYKIPTCTAINPKENTTLTCTSLVLDDKVINLNKNGTYQILYEATNGYGKSTFTKTVIVRDTTKPTIKIANPVIELQSSQVANYMKNEYLNDVTVSDNSNDLIPTTIETDIKSEIGEYYIKYIAKDTSSNIGTYTRKVIVKN